MIRKGFNSKVNEKIDIILKRCDELGIEFDNQIPNHYKLISKNGVYEFTTYNDVLSAIALLKGVK